MPPLISIEPTNLCNLRCPECPSGTGALTRNKGLMSFETFKSITDEVYPYSFYFQLFFQGEPFLNKDIFRMIAYARKQRIYTSVSTNAQLLTDELINDILDNPPDKLIFSIDGIDENSYQSYRIGGSFYRANEALRSLSGKKKELKKRLPVLEFQLIVMKQNENLLKDVIKYAKKSGADKVIFKTMQIYDYQGAKNFLPRNPAFSRYIIRDGMVYPRNKPRNRCLALYKSTVITWDGRVVPCCFDKDAEFSPASFNDKSIKDIWQSVEYNRFRQRILNDRSSVNICNNCTEGTRTNISLRSIK
jgi:radical SAM protein with 4Fe4S-binding SPASM domain